MTVHITYRGIELRVVGDYSPEEPAVMYYPDGSGYPGCGAEFRIQAIYVEDTDINDLFSLDQLDDIRDMCFDNINTEDFNQGPPS